MFMTLTLTKCLIVSSYMILIYKASGRRKGVGSGEYENPIP